MEEARLFLRYFSNPLHSGNSLWRISFIRSTIRFDGEPSKRAFTRARVWLPLCDIHLLRPVCWCWCVYTAHMRFKEAEFGLLKPSTFRTYSAHISSLGHTHTHTPNDVGTHKKTTANNSRSQWNTQNGSLQWQTKSYISINYKKKTETRTAQRRDSEMPNDWFLMPRTESHSVTFTCECNFIAAFSPSHASCTE